MFGQLLAFKKKKEPTDTAAGCHVETTCFYESGQRKRAAITKLPHLSVGGSSCVCVRTCERVFLCANRQQAEATGLGEMALVHFCVETLYLGHLRVRRIFCVPSSYLLLLLLLVCSSPLTLRLLTRSLCPSLPNTSLQRGKTRTFRVWKKKVE